MAVAEPEVRVAAGALRGRLDSGVAVFKGIPFAEPPVRFAAPQPVQAWDGTRDVPYPEELSRRIWQDHVFSALRLTTRM